MSLRAHSRHTHLWAQHLNTRRCRPLVAVHLSPHPSSALSCSGAGHQPVDAPRQTFSILFQDDHLVVIDKPAGFFVHPREDGFPIPASENCLRLLKDQLGGKYLYPVHRLDRPTSGVLVYALTSEAARGFQQGMDTGKVLKTYFCITRGWTDPNGVITTPLSGADSRTEYETIHTAELPIPLGEFDSIRLSLVKVTPITGRQHQIRRHLRSIARPLLGDTEHGDRALNRLFASQLGVPGLFLKATSMQLAHPITKEPLMLHCGGWEPKWHSMFNAFGTSAPDLPVHGGGSKSEKGVQQLMGVEACVPQFGGVPQAVA